MKVVVAIIKPFKLNDVHDMLHSIGISGLTVYEAKGHGHQKGHSEIYRSVEYVAHFLPKLRIEVIVSPELVDRVVEAISMAAKTGESGDGKIYVHSLDQVIRIRTGETDRQAI
jgi:nitrogen regulatory protein P-II 2